MNDLGGSELVLNLFWVPLVLFLGLAPYVTWRRGGSRSRVVVAFLVSLIPYLGWIGGAIIALTTKRTGGSTASMTGRGPVAVPAGESVPSGGLAGGFGKIVVVVILALVPIGSGILGYYLGRQSDQTASPVWTDREIRATGTQNVGTLLCTYHMADGTVRVQEAVIALATDPPSNYFGTPNPFGARTPACPPSP